MNTASVFRGAALGVAVGFAFASHAQDLTLSGFASFEAAYGSAYDLERSVNSGWDLWNDPPAQAFTIEQGRIANLDYGFDARVNFDYANATKSGLEYGARLELDFYASDRALSPSASLPTDIASIFSSDTQISEQDALDLVQKTDALGPDAVEFNDGSSATLPVTGARHRW